MINIKKVYPPLIRYCAKVIPLAFDESLSYYECICNIANHINNEIIPKVNESNEIVNEVQDEVVNLKQYVDDNMLTKDVDDLTNYTKTSDLSNVALTGDYNDLSNKPTIPDVSNFITKDVNDLTYYTLSSNLSSVATSGNYNDLSNKPTIPDVSNFITKDVNDLTYYTLSSSLSSVATSGSYNDLSNKPTIPTVPTNVSAFNNDSGYITKSVNDLTNYTTTTALTTLLSGKENVSETGSNSNGRYIKFDNGIIIEYGIVELGSISYTTSYGSIFLGGTQNITLPYEFSNVNKIDSVNTSLVNIGGGVGGVSGSGYTRTTISIYPWHAVSATLSTIVSFVVIGRWK